MRRKIYPGIRLMVVELSSCFAWSCGGTPKSRITKAEPFQRLAPLVITDRQGADVDIELWHDNMLWGGLMISARARAADGIPVSDPVRAQHREPIAIDVDSCAQLRLGLLCAMGDDLRHQAVPDTVSTWGVPVAPYADRRFMISPTPKQHRFTVGARQEPQITIDVLSACVGRGAPQPHRPPDICAQLSLRAACTDVYDLGAKSTARAKPPGRPGETSQLYTRHS